MMSDFIEIDFWSHKLLLTSNKAIIDAETKTMFVADAHFGKAGFFQHEGVPVPSDVSRADYKTLSKLIDKYDVTKIIFLGDLFHNRHNSEWDVFSGWRNKHSKIQMVLIEGNHDILPGEFYHSACLEILPEPQPFGNLWLAHHDSTAKKLNKPCLFGHIHPGIRLTGGGRQNLTLPAFIVSKKTVQLPAFGSFTGLAVVKPQKSDRVFVVAEEKIFEV